MRPPRLAADHVLVETVQPEVLVQHRLRTMTISHVASLAAIGCVALYALLPGESVSRTTLLALTGAQAFLSVAVGLLPWPRLFASGRGEGLLRVWSTITVVQIAVAVAVTGGAASPLDLLFGLTAVFFAAAWPLRTQAWLGLLTVAAYLVAVRVGSSQPETNAIFLRVAIFAILSGLAAYLSRELQRQLVAHIEARTELERRAAELEHLSLHDVLTGLPNRALFGDRIEQALTSARRRGTRAAVLVLDLDGFKDVNDTLGHEHGDALLREVGPRLRDALRAEDTIARMGGDEFAVLLPDAADPAAAETVAENLVRALEQPFAVGTLTIGIETSIGVALFPDHGTSAAELMRHADDAMYAAKADKTGWRLYDGGRDDLAARRLAILGDLRRALDEHELVVYYQPMADMHTGSLRGVEALVRWQHPQRGLLPPGEFVPLVEQTGLIGPLTLEVLDQALAECRRWRDAGHEVPVSVNLSVRNLHHDRFPSEVAALLAHHELPPSALELEITESAVMTHARRSASVLERLEQMGIRLVLDDFGTGYSSLAYLAELPVGQLKIDRSFVAGMRHDGNAQVIVRSVINIGRNLGLTIVAEGVEDEETWRRLVADGCDVAQGYYLSRPIPAQAFREWLEPRDRAGEAGA